MSGHPIHRVRSFEVLGPNTLRVDFEDGVSRTIDFAVVLQGELFAPLRDPDVFKRVRIDPEVRTLVWPNGADFDPATLHDWPDLLDDLRAMANRWAGAAASDSTQARPLLPQS